MKFVGLSRPRVLKLMWKRAFTGLASEHPNRWLSVNSVNFEPVHICPLLSTMFMAFNAYISGCINPRVFCLPAWHCQWCVEEKSWGNGEAKHIKNWRRNKDKTGILQTLSVSVSYCRLAKTGDAGKALGRTWLATILPISENIGC